MTNHPNMAGKGWVAMMKLLLVRAGTLLIILNAALIPLSGCGVMKDKPAIQDLSLVLAGMDGSDGVSFEGEAALLLSGKVVPESSLYYGGKLADHNKVSLYSMLPDKGRPKKAAAGAGVRDLEQSSGKAPIYYTRLVKEDGEWGIRMAAAEAQQTGPLEALNPLRQLEELQSLEKTVTEETGSGRGTRVLRIELTAEEAGRQLSAELERGMQAIRPEAGGSAGAAAGKSAEVLEARRVLWEQKQAELQQRLNQASIRSVYYLKVDPKRNLPTRLTWKRTAAYPGSAGTVTEETYITRVDFYGYE
ncbi:hypothetical protein [Paenibacillus sp. MMS20-IR301]|uniref:hypothetical protein n=1 Tax=Paenibacillus sp. MMS20-IR301 TaxID=2895946 RepID=UPI0028E88ACC|nr:hypothetical protein [Paenibacillus sp. MMS20-IR301]WNS45783.1 hypothetical protein LOS79_11095 [Paenibacillus sp. MMS20-IR301]